jgi:hypothetical protein
MPKITERAILFYKYFWTVLGIAFFLSIFTFCLNRLIDPYGLYESPRYKGLNINKPKLASNVRLAKMIAIKKKKPKAIVLGNSRAEYGIDPNHQGWSTTNVYNLALAGGNMYEAWRYLQYAYAIEPLNELVLMLDFSMFNAAFNRRLNLNNDEFLDGQLTHTIEGNAYSTFAIPTEAYALWSWDTLINSALTLLNNNDPKQEIYLDNGMRERTHNQNRIGEGHRKIFISAEETHFLNAFNKFSFSENGLDNFEIFEKILIFCHQHNIKLHLAISPIHARLLETIAVKNIYNFYEMWKIKLVQINESASKKLGKSPFSLWDFSGYNSMTTEAVPVMDDITAQMNFYWESSHYKAELGDMVLDRIFYFKTGAKKVPNDFGMLLTSDNIETHLSKIRDDRRTWLLKNPEDAAEIRGFSSLEF